MYLHISSRAGRYKFAAGWRVLLLLALFMGNIHHSYCAAARPDLEQKTARSSLLQWAKDNEFAPVWVPKDGLLKLTNHSAALSFKVDSMLAEINGVHVWLSEPVTLWHGEPCVSSADLQTTITPILYPRSVDLVTSICLDPGHGGKDTGGISGKYMEKEYTLPLARELAAQLEVAGFKVILTRTNDTYVELQDRPALANRRRTGLFISLHFNIGAPGEARGVEVYCLTPARSHSTNSGGKGTDTGSLPGNRQDPQNVLLAYQLQKSLVEKLDAEDRGMRRARFEVLRTAQMPAVLIEGGFLSDPKERQKITDQKYRAQMAAAIVQGVIAYEHPTACDHTVATEPRSSNPKESVHDTEK
jgi:N-acetylmuramoyl-L-alanine amidase